MEPSSDMLSNDYGSELLFRILFVSLTVNVSLAIRLSLTGIAQSVKLLRNKNLVEKLRELSQKEKDIIHIVANEVVNLVLSTIALACVCLYPIQHYGDSRPPALLEILIACNCGRYFYKIGLLVSWKRHGVDTKSETRESVAYNCFKLLYLVPALLFYGYVLASNTLWWVGVIGNFIEMESIVTSIHSILKRVYTAYDTVDVWCRWIQAVSVLCIRFILPLILYHLFSNQQNCIEECSATTRIVTYFYVGLYNLFVFFMKCERISASYRAKLPPLPVQVIRKQPVPYIEINDIFDDSEKAKASMLSMKLSTGPLVVSENQPTWSMVAMEDISCTHTKVRHPPSTNSKKQPKNNPKQHALNNTMQSQQKRVRFADFVQNPNLIALKPTSNMNMDTSDGTKVTGKVLIFKTGESDQ